MARARRATTNIADRRSTDYRRGREAAGLGPARPAGPLAARGANRLQLVVGPQSSHRLAHLVGLRDHDAADLPSVVGLRRKLDRAMGELHSWAADDCRLPPR